MFLLGIRSGSLYQVMNCIRIIGIVIILMYLISFIIQMKEFLIGIKEYIESLKVKVVIMD